MWVCWGAAGLVWLLGAGVSRKQAQPRTAETHDLASTAAAAIAVAAIATPASIWRPLEVASPWLRLAGAGALVAATAAAVWARLALGATWSSRAAVAERHELRTGGPYALTRHPIYTGIVAMVAATALSQGIGRWAAIWLAVLTALIFKIRAEEDLLVREFPNQYRRYQQRVPRLIPLPQRLRRLKVRHDG